jgi:4-phosphopantoate--beta-alanine ligase
MKHPIPENHPRRESLMTRELLIEGYEKKIVAAAGLIAHGRGEAFDYIIGEATNDYARTAIEAAAAAILLAQHPVISVNGNVAVLAPKAVVELAEASSSLMEVNLFYRTAEREKAVMEVLLRAGAKKVYGVGESSSSVIPELGSERRRVDPEGIEKADLVLVPLEDGDRTEALVRLGKTVVTIDLNPLSRTAASATITIVDNCVRALPLLADYVLSMRKRDRSVLSDILAAYDNRAVLSSALSHICSRMSELASERDASAHGKGGS